MRALVQRVSSASVTVDGVVLGSIGRGFLILLAVAPDDDDETARWLAGKLARLRVFEDDGGKMNLSLLEAGGAALVVSQFTLYGSCRKGNRPSFTGSAGPDVAEPLYERFMELLRAEGVTVASGRFGAMMQVSLVNDGPVTLIVDSPPGA